MITDGQQTKDRGSYLSLTQAAEPLKRKGVHIYSLGIGDNVNRAELKQIASHPDNDVFQATSFHGLEKLVQSIIDNICKKGQCI